MIVLSFTQLFQCIFLKNNVRIEKIRTYNQDNISIKQPWLIHIYLFTRSVKADFAVSEKLAHTSHGVSSLILISHPFFFPVASRHAFILFYGSVFSCAPSYCVRWLSICVSNKMSEPGTIFSPLFLSLCFKPKGARVYTSERGFSAKGRKGGEKDSKSDLPSGKMLYRIRFLPRAQRGIRFSSKVYFAVSVWLVEYASRESTWRAVTFNFLCDARNEKCVCYTFDYFFLFSI